MKAQASTDTALAALLRIAVVQAQATRITVATARLVMDGLFDLVRKEVLATGRFSIPRVGVFYLSQSKARVICNPKTHQKMMLEPTWRVGFRPSKFWKGAGTILFAKAVDRG